MSSYTKIASHHLLASAAIAVATVLSVVSPAFAADAPATTATASKHTATREQDPQTGTLIHKTSSPTDLGPITVYGGASLRPGDAQWTDSDTSAPALPMTRDQGTATY